jgi:heme-degrading monooxygenase HmoA
VRRDDADAYVEYIVNTGMAEYRATPGNQGAWMLRRDDGDRSEIITFSLWDSRDSIRAFAGEDIDQAVFYPEDDRFLIERDLTVRHYDVVN